MFTTFCLSLVSSLVERCLNLRNDIREASQGDSAKAAKVQRSKARAISSFKEIKKSPSCCKQSRSLLINGESAELRTQSSCGEHIWTTKVQANSVTFCDCPDFQRGNFFCKHVILTAALVIDQNAQLKNEASLAEQAAQARKAAKTPPKQPATSRASMKAKRNAKKAAAPQPKPQPKKQAPKPKAAPKPQPVNVNVNAQKFDAMKAEWARLGMDTKAWDDLFIQG